MKKLSFIWVLPAVMISFASCVSVRTISLERMQAADINFPEQVRRVGIVDYVPQLERDSNWARAVSGTLGGDGRIASESLAQKIAETCYFDQVVICDSALREQSAPQDVHTMMDSRKVDSLIHVLDVDVLLALERIDLKLEDGVVYDSERMQHVPSVDVVVTPFLRAYKLGRELPLFMISKSDTICWAKTANVNLEQIIESASEYAATIPLKHMLPSWEEIQRCYFDGGISEMRDAGVYMREQNWDEAVLLWRKIYERKKGKLKMYAAFNLALYHELQDEYELAKEYLDVASELSDADSPERTLIQYYAFQLREQEKENRKLQIQMKRFE